MAFKTNVRSLLVLAFATVAFAQVLGHQARSVEAAAAAQGSDQLGQWWDESEANGMHGTWVRKGPGNDFAVSFVNSNGESSGGFATISIQGNRVRVHRQDATAPQTCDYTGTVSGNQVKGQYTCTLGGKTLGPHDWKATITG